LFEYPALIFQVQKIGGQQGRGDDGHGGIICGARYEIG